jgi:hypothetical protein
MKNVYLISEATLKQFSLINNNVDGKYIGVAIQATQDIDLQTLIGEALVKRLCALVVSNELNDKPNYKLLLDEYITPYMTWQVMSTIQVGLNYKLVNSGVITNEDSNKSHLDYKNNQLLIEQYKSYANSYAIKLKSYLDCNATLYPEYKQCVNKQHAEDINFCGICFD